MKSLLYRLRRDERGLAAVEMGLVAPVLLFLTAGVADVSQMVARTIDLQQAAVQTAALAMAQPQPNDYSALRTIAAQAAGLPAAQVAVNAGLSCDGVVQAQADGACPTGQQQARYVNITFNASYVPTWRHFGIAANVPITVSRQVRVQ